MQNNDRFYTFLFSHSLKSKIYIRRVRVSKRLLHYSTIGLFLAAGFSSLGIGIAGIFNFSDMAVSAQDSPILNQLAANLPERSNVIDYSRPGLRDGFSINSGGPLSAILLSEDAEIENRLRVIQTMSNQAYVPSIWAHMGKINNEFGFRRNPFGGRFYEFHSGMDIDGERGDLVVAPAHGLVIKAGYQGGYGNMIEIDHGNGLTTRYGHLSKIEVEIGDTIQRGQLIAYVGSTGRSTGPHLHYELRLDDRPINPRRFLPPEPTEIRKLS